MIVGCRKKVPKELQNRCNRSMQYAITQIKNSPLSPFVRALYLYGSCARKQQTFNSDIDLFLELKKESDKEQLKNAIIQLKSNVIPLEMNLPEVDLKVVFGDDWKSDHSLYYQNIKREGISIWENH